MSSKPFTAFSRCLRGKSRPDVSTRTVGVLFRSIPVIKIRGDLDDDDEEDEDEDVMERLKESEEEIEEELEKEHGMEAILNLELDLVFFLTFSDLELVSFFWKSL